MASLTDRLEEEQKKLDTVNSYSRVDEAQSHPEMSISEMAIQRRNARDPSAKTFDFYISKEKQDEIKLGTASKVTDILDFIDNINRPQYAVTAGLAEGLRSIKEDESISKTAGDIVSEAVKGFKREKRVGARDILKITQPDLIKTVEENTEFKLFGVDALSMDAVTPVAFAGDILLDPLTYVGVGVPLKLIGKAFDGSGRLAKSIATKSLGEDTVSKIVTSTKKAYIEKIAPLFNQKAIWEEHGASELMDILTSSKEIAEGKSAREALKIATLSEKQGMFGKVRDVLDLPQSKQVHQAMQSMSDEAVDVFGELWAKELGVSTKAVSEIKQIDELLNDIKMSENKAERASLTKKLNDELLSRKINAAEHIKNGMLNDEGIRKFSNNMAMAERDASLEYAKHSLNISKQLKDESMKRIDGEILEIQKSLKSGVKLTHKFVQEDVNNVSMTLKNLDDSFGKLVSGSATEEMFLGLRGQMDVLKNRISFLNKYQRSETKEILKSGQSLSKIGAELNSLDHAITKTQFSSAVEFTNEMKNSIKGSIRNIATELQSFKKIRQSELSKLKKGSIESEKLSGELVDKYKDQLKSLMTDRTGMEREYSKELIRSGVTARKSDKMMNLMKDKYYNAFNALNSGKAYQLFLQKNMHVKDQIFERGIKELPEELREPTRKLRTLYDDYAARGTAGEEPFMKGASILYAPRAIQQDFIQEALSKIPEFSQGSKGFLKHRKFEKYSEFKDWAEKQGLKVDEDAITVAMRYMKNFDISYAKHNVEKALLAKFEIDKLSELPKGLKNSIDYLYRDGRIRFDNPVMDMVYRFASKVSNATKMALTITNPAFHGRNILGFPFLAATTAGMKNGYDLRNFSDAFLIKTGREGKLTAKGGKQWEFSEIRKAAEDSGYFASSQTRGDFKTSANLMLGRYKWTDPKRWMGELFKFTMHAEDMGRYGALLANLRAGNDMPKALDLAKKAMFDYNLINSPVDKALQGVLGFYTYSRRNLPRQVMTVLEDPKQYSILSRALGHISNREELNQDEISLLNGFERSQFKIFGEVIDGVRTFKTLGFFPVEEAYQTLNSVTDKKYWDAVKSKLNPAFGAFLDWFYGKDSFYGTDLGNYLPGKYAKVIPESLQKALSLEKRIKPKYRGGEQVGTEEVLYGDVNTVFMIRKFPIGSRFLNDIAEAIDKKQKPGVAASGYLFGIKEKELDVEARKKSLKRKQEEALIEKAKAEGAVTYERVYTPAWQKPTGTPEAIKRETRRKRAEIRRRTYE